MKKSILIISILLCPLISFSQKIVKNELDEFTGDKVKVSSWAKLNWDAKINSYARFKKINENYILELKAILNDNAYTVEKGEILYIKFTDNEIIKLNLPKVAFSRVGAGSTGISGSNLFGVKLRFPINQQTMGLLKSKNILKLRIYTSMGYFQSEVSKKRALNFQKLANIM